VDGRDTQASIARASSPVDTTMTPNQRLACSPVMRVMSNSIRANDGHQGGAEEVLELREKSRLGFERSALWTQPASERYSRSSVSEVNENERRLPSEPLPSP
jgi:hypothetical protein